MNPKTLSPKPPNPEPYTPDPRQRTSLFTNLPPPVPPAAPAHRAAPAPPPPPTPWSGLPMSSSSCSDAWLSYLPAPAPPRTLGESSPLLLPVLLSGDPARGKACDAPPPPPPPLPPLLPPPRAAPYPPRPNLSSVPAAGAEKVMLTGTCTCRRARVSGAGNSFLQGLGSGNSFLQGLGSGNSFFRA